MSQQKSVRDKLMEVLGVAIRHNKSEVIVLQHSDKGEVVLTDIDGQKSTLVKLSLDDTAPLMRVMASLSKVIGKPYLPAEYVEQDVILSFRIEDGPALPIKYTAIFDPNPPLGTYSVTFRRVEALST
jgi:hypothetical protein